MTKTLNPQNSNDQAINHYKEMNRIRIIEEVLAKKYRDGVMRTPTHFGIGQEAVAVGVCSALERNDVVYSHHRCHNHYLAQGGDLYRLAAELMGREGGCSRGRGGSVHITDLSANFIGASPILGHSIALATGAALASSMDEANYVGIAFFGEGALDEGSCWESFNYASIKKLPVLYVCENNLYATESPLSVRQPEGTELCERLKSFGIKAKKINGNDVFEVFEQTKLALESCRSGDGPYFLECMTYRWLEHVGPLWDYEVNRSYRSKDELLEWMNKCPIKRLKTYLIENKILTESEIVKIDTTLTNEVIEIINQAENSPWPEPSTLFDNAY